MRRSFLELGGTEVFPLLECDDASNNDFALHTWTKQVSSVLSAEVKETKISKPWLSTITATKPMKALKQPKLIRKSAEMKVLSPIKETDVDEEEFEEEDRINDAFVAMELDSDQESMEDNHEHEPVLDLEDLGSAMANSQTANASKSNEMVTKLQRKALTKEGYKIIGSHSAVKLCRWTKNQLRGRGGCYKHTFYGITSYQCMEATPSLACANKCVFCWRHHKNPVGTEWRWKEDEPKYVNSDYSTYDYTAGLGLLLSNRCLCIRA